MKHNMLRNSGWIVILLVVALILVSGCTRSKSEPPPDVTAGTNEATETLPPGVTPSPTVTLTGQEEIDATSTAWAVETATAAAPTSEPGATAEPEATQPPEATQAPEPEVTQAPGATQPPEATEAPVPTQPPTSGGERIHVVKPGENLYRISLSYGLETETVAAYNGITNPNQIYVGQEIKIPSTDSTYPPATPPPTGGTGYHVVQPGENLFRISLNYSLPYTQVAAANGLSYPYTIYVGQKLIIP